MDNSHPIIFAPSMVRAIRDGTKTQTRRKVRSKTCPFGVPGDTLWIREQFWIDADGKPFYREDYWPDDTLAPKWKPSIHMPRTLCRQQLKVTDIRREALQDITQIDAMREGVDVGEDEDFVRAFAELWEDVSGSWDDNPDVWVIEFEPLPA